MGRATQVRSVLTSCGCLCAASHWPTSAPILTASQSFFPLNLRCFADLKANLLLFFQVWHGVYFVVACKATKVVSRVVIWWKYRGFYRQLWVFFGGTGTPTIVETRSAYRAHFIFDKKQLSLGKQRWLRDSVAPFYIYPAQKSYIYRVLKALWVKCAPENVSIGFGEIQQF